MPDRRHLLFLVTGLAVLMVLFAILLAFHALFSAVGDQAAARVLFGFSVACLVMLVADVVLLVGVLGLRAIQDQTSGSSDRTGDDSPADTR